MIKKFLYIFIPFLAVLLMSHNTFAAVSSYDLSNFSVIASTYRVPLYCKFDGSTVVTNSVACTLNSNTDGKHTLSDIHSNNLTWQYKKGDIIEFDIALYTLTEYNNENPVLYVGNGSTYNNLLIFDVTEKVSDTYYDLDAVGTTGGIVTGGNYYGHVYHFSAQVLNDFSGDVGLSSTNANFPIFSFYTSEANTVYFRISNLLLWRKSPTNPVNDEQKEATQDAANNSATSGGNSSSDSQTATSSLLSVITSGIGAITSASPTNCKINGNMGNLDVGNIDLCANPVPTFMSLIGSIIAVLVVLPLVIVLFNRFISIIRSFQR